MSILLKLAAQSDLLRLRIFLLFFDLVEFFTHFFLELVEEVAVLFSFLLNRTSVI